MADKLGIYIHIPFCRSKCDYCDFYSLAGREDQMDRYQKALLAHLKETAPLAQGYPVDSIYFGGGTPSYYGAKRIKELLAHLSKLFQVEKDAEITVECNPDSVDLKSLRILRKAGVNRLSMGMQSAQEAELRAIHRIHTPQQTNQAVEAARKAKFTNLSLDLIYGLPGQTMESWKATVEHALSLIPQHLSCYGLKVEEGTPLARRVAEGEVLPDDDQQADLYLWTVGRLERAGLPQYEISNFAKPGYESRHNLRYWLTRPYIGFGPGAHSDFWGAALLLCPGPGRLHPGGAGGGRHHRLLRAHPPEGAVRGVSDAPPAHCPRCRRPGVPPHLFHGLRSPGGPPAGVCRPGLGGGDGRALAAHPQGLPGV